MSLFFYTVDGRYCDFLRKYDPCVPYTMDKKAIRPFVGVVFNLNRFFYYAPLTSPKKKHLSMRNQIDFLKIQGGQLGAVNFNNMIPVPERCLSKVELKIFQSDSDPEIKYKRLLSNQLSWCNSHRENILERAAKLYSEIASGNARSSLSDRCCNFLLDEQKCLLYCKCFLDS